MAEIHSITYSAGIRNKGRSSRQKIQLEEVTGACSLELAPTQEYEHLGDPLYRIIKCSARFSGSYRMAGSGWVLNKTPQALIRLKVKNYLVGFFYPLKSG